MLAYDYMKEHKRFDIATNWLELFKDAPDGIKHEVLEMEKEGIPINDVTLYFYDKLVMNRCIMGGIHKPDRAIWGRKALISYIYTYAITNEDFDSYGFFCKLSKSMLFHIDWTWSLISCVMARYTRNPMSSISAMLYDSLRHGERYESYRAYRDLSERDIEMAFEYFTFDFIRNVDSAKMDDALSLLKDVDKAMLRENGKIDSLNMLNRLHDATIEAELNRIAKDPKNCIPIEYHPRFKEIVESYGFKLPESRNDMIRRGKMHHNCVATYADRHLEYKEYGGEMTRLVFSEDATAELTFAIENGLIVYIRQPQYKGKNNVNVDIPIELTKLKIALTGESMEILSRRQLCS